MASTAIETPQELEPDAARSQAQSNGLLAQAKGQASKLTDMGFAKVAELADGKKHAAVQQVNGIAELVREFGDAAGAQFGPAAGDAIGRGAQAVERLAAGLDERSIEDLVETSRTAIVRNPGAALAVAAVVGFAGGRILKGAIERGTVRSPRTTGKRGTAA